MDTLSFDNILDDDFTVEENAEKEEKEEKEKSSDESQNDELEFNDEITEVDDLEFGNQPESVGDEDDTRDKEDADRHNGDSTSPITFSSIAEAFAEEGILPDLDENEAKGIRTAADFVDLMKRQIQSQLDETQKRISNALDAGMEPEDIRIYEGNIKYLNGISEADLDEESEEAETLRKKLIFQDFINHGIKREKAVAWTQKSVDNGTDKEDAKAALTSNIEYFNDLYNNKIKEAQQYAENEKKERQRQTDELKKSIMEDEKVFGSLQVDKNTRKKIFDNLSQPVYRDKDTGNVYTALQKYEMDHPTDFLKYVSMCYTLTDGFSKIENLTSGIVKKEVKSKMRDLEQKLNNTVRTSDGKLDFLSGIHDSESSKGRDIQLDI